jgi:DNA-binding protein YbaB
MFGNIFDNLKERQSEMKTRLAGIVLETDLEGGAIKIKVNANREILDIKIDAEKMDLEDLEKIEDLLVSGINRALSMAAEKEAAEAQSMINDMMPPGLGGLLSNFK